MQGEKGVEIDYIRAVDWYTNAAEQGNEIAIYQLGCCYYFGHGIRKDEGESIKCFKRAVKMGNKMAKKTLSKILYMRGELCFDDVSLQSAVN